MVTTPLKLVAGVNVYVPSGLKTKTPAEDFNGTVVIQYVVCDIFNACDTATLIIRVIPVNDAPIADDAVNTTRNDTPVSGTLVPNVFVIDKTVELTFGQIGTISPTEGTIIINSNGTYTFTPNPSFVGVVTVVYVVCAGANACDTATLTITVTPTNRAPIANDDSNSTYKNNPVSGTIITNDSDPDGNTLTINTLPVTNPTNGTVVINPNGTFTYTPQNGFVGRDTFTYQVCDNGLPTKCDTATVTITVIDLPKTITSTIENTLIVQVTDTICLNTRELIGKQFTITNICPSSGQIVEYSIITGTLCIKMVAIAKGDDRGCFVVCDEYGLCDTTYIITKVVDRTVTKRIKAVNDEVTTKKGQPIISVVMNNDSLYNEGVKDVVVVVQGNHGQAEVDSSNNIIYTPEADFCGTDSITYQICSAAGCDMAVVRIKVICNGFNVYNGFSPNNDGSNETLVIEGLENFPNNKIEIYNRWGNKVYFSKNYQNDWAGTWGNKKLPDGTYYYLIDDGEGNHYTGYIQIHQ